MAILLAGRGPVGDSFGPDSSAPDSGMIPHTRAPSRMSWEMVRIGRTPTADDLADPHSPAVTPER